MSKFMKKACLLSSFFSSIKSYTFLRQVPLFVLPVEHEGKKSMRGKVSEVAGIQQKQIKGSLTETGALEGCTEEG